MITKLVLLSGVLAILAEVLRKHWRSWLIRDSVPPLNFTVAGDRVCAASVQTILRDGATEHHLTLQMGRGRPVVARVSPSELQAAIEHLRTRGIPLSMP